MAGEGALQAEGEEVPWAWRQQEQQRTRKKQGRQRVPCLLVPMRVRRGGASSRSRAAGGR